jgi:predicted GTPase
MAPAASRRPRPRDVVDPRPAAAPLLRVVFVQYPHIGPVVPAVGYSPAQLKALRLTLARASADVVIAATPVDPARLVSLDKPIIRARYDFAEASEPGLGGLIDDWLARLPARPR